MLQGLQAQGYTLLARRPPSLVNEPENSAGNAFSFDTLGSVWRVKGARRYRSWSKEGYKHLFDVLPIKISGDGYGKRARRRRYRRVGNRHPRGGIGYSRGGYIASLHTSSRPRTALRNWFRNRRCQDFQRGIFVTVKGHFPEGNIIDWAYALSEASKCQATFAQADETTAEAILRGANSLRGSRRPSALISFVERDGKE
jgi:hypothetical protein